jgi:hypothetical protein
LKATLVVAFLLPVVVVMVSPLKADFRVIFDGFRNASSVLVAETTARYGSLGASVVTIRPELGKYANTARLKATSSQLHEPNVTFGLFKPIRDALF